MKILRLIGEAFVFILGISGMVSIIIFIALLLEQI